MKPLALALALSAVAPAAALAQDGDLRQAARDFVQSPAMQTTLDELLSTDVFVAQLQASGAQLSEAQVRRASEIVAGQLAEARPDFESALAAAAANTFTLDELDGMIAYYESEVGRATTAKMGDFMESFYENAGDTLAETQRDIIRRIAEDFAAPGQGAGEGTDDGAGDGADAGETEGDD